MNDNTQTKVEAAPKGIPQNIWESACNTFAKMQRTEEGGDDRVIIAFTMMASYSMGWNNGVKAERKICAEIVEDYLKWAGIPNADEVVTEVGLAIETIAAAIHQRSAGDGE